MARCTICEKRAVSGNTVSHSEIHTKRRFKPNIQKVNGLLLCTKCLRTIKRFETQIHEHEHALAESAKETIES